MCLLSDSFSIRQDLAATYNTFLKFGTVFLVYRLCMFLFIEKGNTFLFDYETLQFALSVLLGFAVYYLLVRKFSYSFENVQLNRVVSDLMMFGTVLLTSHAVDTTLCEAQFLNSEWLKATGYMLLSLTVYNVLYTYEPDYLTRQTVFVNDVVKYTSVLTMHRLLQGGSVLNMSWLASMSLIGVGFSAYNYGTSALEL